MPRKTVRDHRLTGVFGGTERWPVIPKGVNPGHTPTEEHPQLTKSPPARRVQTDEYEPIVEGALEAPETDEMLPVQVRHARIMDSFLPDGTDASEAPLERPTTVVRPRRKCVQLSEEQADQLRRLSASRKGK